MSKEELRKQLAKALKNEPKSKEEKAELKMRKKKGKSGSSKQYMTL